jgi:hypothetical protein
MRIFLAPILNSLLFLLVMPNYYFLAKTFSLDQSYDHSAQAQYTRKEGFPASYVKI